MAGGVDWEQVKLQQEGIRATVLKRAEEHPPKPMKLWKLLAILVPIFLVFAAIAVLGIWETLPR